MRPSDSRSVTVLPGTSGESQHSKEVVLPPLTSHYPQWSRGGKLGIGLCPRPLSNDNENGLPCQQSSLSVKVNKKGPDLSLVGRSEGLVMAPADPLLRITQLEQNIRFLQDQHKLMLTSLHQEVEQLRQANRDLQFQLVFSKSGFIQSSPSPSSPEDESKPKIILSPKQLNMTSLQVEILEKEISELKAALQEAKTKNVYLTGIVEEQKKKLERLECRRKELEAVGNKITPGMKLDAQNQAGTSMTNDSTISQEVLDEQTLAVKLEEAEKIIRRLRRENEENRRELAVIRANLSKSLGGSGGGRQLGGGGGNSHRGGGSSGGGGSHHRSHNQQQSQSQRFPPLHTQSYWHHGQQAQHRGGIEFVSHRHCANGGSNGVGRLEKETQLVGRPAPSLPNLRNNGTSSGYGFSNSNNGNSHRRGGHFNGNGNHYYRGSKDEVGDGGRKYRGGGGSRGSRERKQ
ncbi:keratin, type I cytoskeletal 9-like isoform X2 [Zootermopsis nevadensis]|uniref:keratin, type I cytoskeletal 9-like isoform X2 n=1 Tax=Zootermopsis nevadensis TaxID=136037 RepID=UPI000B8E411B|nr:keratin, type I cytoskeletal 9-like isoform X2 [Zootermopsis nevadensis]